MPSFFVRLLCLVSSPRFLAWLFRPAFKDNKVISSFSTFLRLLLSFFDIPRIISLFSSLCLFFSLFILFSEPLGVLRIASLVSAPLLFFLSVFSLSIFFYSISSSLSHLSISISSISYLHLLHHLLLFSIVFSSCLFSLFLSHLTFPASFRYFLRLFSLFSLSFQSLLVLSASLLFSLLLFLIHLFFLFFSFFS